MKILYYAVLAAVSVSIFGRNGCNGFRTMTHRKVQTVLFHAPKHDVGGGGQSTMEELSPEQKERVSAFIEHQQNVPKIGFAADVRSLVQYNHGFACMSTNSKSNTGFPGGSVVGFAVDDDGSPVFVFSGMSSHTQDILKDPRCSLTVADKNFKGAADGKHFMSNSLLSSISSYTLLFSSFCS